MFDNDRIRLVAGASALLMLAVVAASAQIRAAAGLDAALVALPRGIHRIAASTVALLVATLLVLAWRRPRIRGGAVAAFVLMLALSAVGWAGGTAPGPAAAAFNQLGGIALTGLLAWILGAASAGADSRPNRRLAHAALLLAALQAAAGGLAAVLLAPAAPPLVVAHAAAGLAAAATVAALGARHAAIAALAPLAGVLALLHPSLQASHALAAALLVAAAAHASGKS